MLVFCDSDRFWKEPVKFGGVTVGLILLGLGLVGLTGLVPFAANSLVLLMMLDYIGEQQRADRIRAALAHVLQAGVVLTHDRGGRASTTEFTEAVCREVEK